MLGTAQFGMHYGISNSHGMTSNHELKKILDFCKKKDIYSFDTAPSYKKSESRLGGYIKNDLSYPWEVTTKVIKDIPITEQLEKSIENLGIAPKVILAHRPEDYLNTSFRNNLFSLKSRYKNLKVGVSVYNTEEVLRILDAKMPDVLQIPINIFDNNFVKSGLINSIHAEGVEIQARSIFLQGLLYLPLDTIKRKFNDILNPIKKINKILSGKKISISEFSLIWVHSLKEISNLVVGINNLDHLIFHLNSLKKNVDNETTNEILQVNYDNEKILNPALWNLE